MLFPERNKNRLGFHKCLGSKRPMLFPERDKNRLGVRKCLGPQRVACCSQNEIKTAKALTRAFVACCWHPLIVQVLLLKAFPGVLIVRGVYRTFRPLLCQSGPD